ncbi:MAG: hypothetical protein IPH71_10155 [Proteobacteria bacterium]|nr:hypothetical protein [Pseudomonadota bacterium]
MATEIHRHDINPHDDRAAVFLAPYKRDDKPHPHRSVRWRRLAGPERSMTGENDAFAVSVDSNAVLWDHRPRRAKRR